MRLLMTTDAVGGVWQYSLALARGLVELFGCRVLLVAFGEPSGEDLKECIPGPGVDLLSMKLKLEWMPDSREDVQKARHELQKLARDWRADVLHSNQFCFGSIDSTAPRLVVAHSDLLGWIAWHRNAGVFDLDEIESDPSQKAYYDLVGSGLAGAAAVACPSRFMSRHLDEAYGCPSDTIYNGLWPDLYSHAQKEPIAVVAGRLWDEAKMAFVAAKAVAGLPLGLEMLGPTVGPNGEAALLPELDNVSYRGQLTWKQTRDLVGSARFYLATSSYEPFGLSVLEAALSGCTIVANDIPSFREIWKDTVAYYRRNDPADLAEQLSRLMDKPEETERLAKAARARALERYTGQKMATQYYRLYREM